MLPRDRASLLDIHRSATRIMQVTTSRTFEEFANDWVLHQAVIRELEVIGEATKRLNIAFRDQHPEIPWKKIAGLRDFLIHVYDQVDLTIVWEITQRDVPDLVQGINVLLQDSNPTGNETHG